MAVPKDKVYALLQSEGVTTQFRALRIWITHPNGSEAPLLRLEEYKIGKIRHLVAQLGIDREKARKFIPEI